MDTIMLTVYVLIWPVIVAGVLVYISRGFITDLVKARRKGRRMV